MRDGGTFVLKDQNIKFLMGLNGLLGVYYSVHKTYTRLVDIYYLYVKINAFKGQFSDFAMVGHFEAIMLASQLNNQKFVIFLSFHLSLA